MTSVAREYSGALFELCSEEGVAAEVADQLLALRKVLAEFPDWVRVLACPTIAASQRTAAAAAVLCGRVHPYLANFVRLLIDNGRAGELDAIAAEYGRLYDEAAGILPVRAVTALPLTADQTQRLTRRLAKATGRTIRLENVVDAECIGGVRLEAAGRSIDGSIRASLDRLRQRMAAQYL